MSHILNRFTSKLRGELVEVTVYYEPDSGTKTFVNGFLQSVDGEPSILFTDGSKQYHDRGELHKVTGPAIVTANGKGYWFYRGRYCGTGNEPNFELCWEKLIKYTDVINPRIIEIQKQERVPEDHFC